MEFLHGGLLTYGLPALSIPIIIHLLNRRRFRRLRWAAIEFVLKAKKKNRRRVRFENILLLILRTLLVLLILLMISRPVSTDGALSSLLPGSSESVERIILLDDSASLSEKLGGETSFARARSAVVTFCRDLAADSGSDQITLIRGSRPEVPEAVRIAPGSKDMEGLLERMGSWTTTDVPIDLVRAARTVASGAASLEAQAGERGDANRKRVLYIVTDMRKADWLEEGRAAATELAEQLREFQSDKEQVAILVIDVSSPESRNIGVTSFESKDRVILTNVPVRFEAKVKNWGEAPVSGLQLMLTMGESTVPVQSIDTLQGGQEVTVDIRTTFREPGITPLSLEVVGAEGLKDMLASDDVRYLSVDVLEGVRALVVDGEPSNELLEGEVDYLTNAMAPPGDVVSGAIVRVVREEDVFEEDLSKFEIIVLANVESWPEERLLALESFVRRGGGLAIFVGDRVEGGRYGRQFWRGGKGLLPCPLGELLGSGDAESPTRLAASEVEHPLTRNFAGMEELLLGRIRFWRYFDVPTFDPEKVGADAEIGRPSVVLSYNNPERTPAIVEKTFGEGRVLLFNTSADGEWTNWPKLFAYVPIVQEMTRFLAPSSAARRNISAGEDLVRVVNTSRYEDRARLQPPGYPDAPERTLFARREETGAQMTLTVEDTLRAGVYTLVLQPRGGDAAEREPYAVNLIAREGDLDKITPTQLAAALPEVNVTCVQLLNRSLLDLTRGKRREMWKTALMSFLVLLIVEGFLALRAGHHRAVAPPEA